MDGGKLETVNGADRVFTEMGCNFKDKMATTL